MNKYKFIAILILYSFSVESFTLREKYKNPEKKYQIKSIINKFKKNEFKKLIKDFLKNSRPSRMVGTKGNIDAHNYILAHLRKVDTFKKNLIISDEFSPDIKYAKKFYTDDFKKQIVPNFTRNSDTYRSWKKFTDSAVQILDQFKNHKAHNIIWEKKGSLYPNEVIVLSANFDTVSMDMKNFLVTQNKNQPGADNNATGVSILLGLANILSQVNIKRTVRIVFFDFEELGFLGSHYFTKKYKDELNSTYKFHGSIHLLALGHDTKRSDLKKKNGNMRIYTRSVGNPFQKQDHALAKELVNYGKSMKTKTKFEIIPNGMKTSSHINFWKNGLRSITFSENWEEDSNIKRHHNTNDFFETLNMKSFYENFKYISGTVLVWAQKPSK